MRNNSEVHGPLGRKVEYQGQYEPSLLFPIARSGGRGAVGIQPPLPFVGVDIWNAYEVSWLEPGGVPRIAMAEIRIAAESLNIVESKSVKLYLNSFNQTKFASEREVCRVIEQDLAGVVAGDVSVQLILPEGFAAINCIVPAGFCLDNLPITTERYSPAPELLVTSPAQTTECIYSNLLRTLCPVTGQPDWATVIIDYTGPCIDHRGLLAYLISYRQHQGFHESCVERIFMDIMTNCTPARLTVEARFTRRGGIDINPIRSTCTAHFPNRRLARQ